uniref:Histone-lysine N-methyltransferase SETMAR n=1 Tax=Cacopsylla melanoneura TaxID=428564 RepID=A0A8D8SVK0_9HEMI
MGISYFTVISQLLTRFDDKLNETRPHLVKKKNLVFHENAPAHSSAVVAAKFNQLGYELSPRPPYSPNLAPCNYFLFPNLNIWLRERSFTSKDFALSKIKQYFDGFAGIYLLEGLKKW